MGIRVVISGFLPLVEIIESRKLTEWLCLIPYKDTYWYDPLNRMPGYRKAVPSCKLNLSSKIGGLSQGADHKRLNNFSLRQRLQIKCVLNVMHGNKTIVTSCSFHQKRYYVCQARNNYIKCDNGTINVVGQNVRNDSTNNQGNFHLLKVEIKKSSK